MKKAKSKSNPKHTYCEEESNDDTEDQDHKALAIIEQKLGAETVTKFKRRIEEKYDVP